MKNTPTFFFDTEFIEGFTKPKNGEKSRHFIDLISIGIKAANGNEYYAISSEFDPNDADEWVKENVIAKLDDKTPRLSNKEIAEEILHFVYANGYGREYAQNHALVTDDFAKEHPIKFYSYYADYDWVLMCSLFGKMINLPKGFPMFCLDIKQMMEEAGYDKAWKNEHCPEPEGEHHARVDARWHKKLYDTIIRLTPMFRQ